MDIDLATVFSVEYTELAREITDAAHEMFGSARLSTVDTDMPIEGDLCVAVGGDGSYLEAVYRCSDRDIPVLGIHAGTLGFLSRVPPEDARDAFESIITDDADVIGRGRAAATVGDRFSAAGLNEVRVTRKPPERAVDRKICSLHVYLDNTYVGQFDGDGLAVATPTGSTAIALSAGGPIHYPNENFALQLTPILTHGMGIRPLIVDGDTEFRIYPETEVNVMVDGGRDAVTLDAEEELAITGASTPARLVRTEFDDSFFDALSGKLGWGPRGVDETGPHPLRRGAR